ncbi:MAG: GAF domain-containing protein, partial [Caldilineaceae bacterium]|nr:GAF domain-containing protein [Caldilineaceae bacterium]
MIPDGSGSDYQREALKYGRLLNALRRAIDAIRELEEKSHPNIDDILMRLLPDLSRALEGNVAFVARVPDASQQVEAPHGYELVAIYPDELASEQVLPSSELLRALIRDGKPRVIAPLGDDSTRLIAGLELFHATSAILVRVETVRNIYIVGVCNKQESSEVPFLASDRMTLASLLELIAMGARVGERRHSELRSIQEILAAVSDETDLDVLLALIVQHAAAVFPAAAISLMLWDDFFPRMKVAAVHGLSDAYRLNYALPRDMLAQLLPEEQDAVIVIEEFSGSRLGDGKWIAEEQLTSAMLAPMYANNQLIGLLNVYAKNDVHVFGETAQRLVQVFAGEAAIALKNARLFKRRADEQAAIKRVGETSTQGDISQVWQTIAEATGQLTKASSVTLISVDRYADQLIVAGTWDRKLARWVPHVNDKFDLDESSMNGHVALTREPYYASDVYATHVHFNPRVAVAPSGTKTHSAYCVPLVAKDQVLGTLYVASDREDGINAEERRFVDSLMPHAAVALLNAELLAQAQLEKVKREELIDIQSHAIRIQQSIADILDIPAQVAQIRKEFASLFYDISGIFIATYDENTGIIELPEVYERNREVEDNDPRKQPGAIYGPRRLGERRGIVDYVIQHGHGIHIRDFSTHPLWNLIDDEYKEGIRSCIAVPMALQGKVKGVIGLRSYRSTNAYSEYHHFLLETVASQIATVMENSRRYELRLRELRAVSRFQERISELDVDTAGDQSAHNGNGGVVTREIHNIYRFARDAMSQVDMYTDDMYIALYHPEDGTIEFPLIYDENRRLTQAEVHHDPVFRPYRDRSVGEYADLTEFLATGRQREALLFCNREELEQYVDASPAVDFAPKRSQSWLGAPMIYGDKSIGMIGLRHFKKENIFDDRHKELIQTIARQAAIVIENARLYENSRRQLETLGRSNAIALMGAWGADVVHEINREIGHIQRGLYLLRLLTDRCDGVGEQATAQIEDLNQRVDELASPEWLEELSLDDGDEHAALLDRA